MTPSAACSSCGARCPARNGGLIFIRNAVKALDVSRHQDEDGRPAPTRASAELPDAIFGVEPNVAVMHQVVTAQLAAARAGTQSTKTRAEVKGGGAKPWRQKGTGRARQGSIRAPHWRGGGVAHGPKPRSYRQRTPKKMVRLALIGALSDRASESKLSSSTSGAGTSRRPRTRRRARCLGLHTAGQRAAAGAARARPHRRGRVEVVPQPR